MPSPSDAAMTGEITLSGLVLPVGGIKEKVLAASASEHVVLPRDNEPDLRELPDNVQRANGIHVQPTASRTPWRPALPEVGASTSRR